MRRLTTAMAACCALLAGLLLPFTTEPAPPAAAAEAALFNPGYIISDVNFTDEASMTVAGVQSFLNDKGWRCSNATPACLKDYRQDAPSRAAEAGLCAEYPGGANQTVAQIIIGVAAACDISPKVLLVLIEKEQGLVTTSRPTDYAYRYTTGWCVTDSGSCVGTQVGFSNQMFMAARQFKMYAKYPSSYRYKPGQTNSIQYHPNAGCGSTSVYVENQATASLYNYTPYVPNAAALANLYGVGDGCSAYGNRNFWRLYSDWFGSPTDLNLAQAPGSSEVYLIAGDKKYRVGSIPGVADLSALGSVKTLDATTLAAVPTAGRMESMVKSAQTGQYWILDQGRKLPLDNCSEGQSYGFSCNAAPALLSAQLSMIPTGPSLTNNIKTTDGFRYLVTAGARQEYWSAKTLRASGVTLGSEVLVAERTMAHLEKLPPFIPDRVTFSGQASENVIFRDGSTYYEIDATLWAQGNVGVRMAGPVSMTDESIAHLPARTIVQPFVQSAAGDVFFFTRDGLSKATGIVPAPEDVTAVSDEFLARAGLSTRTEAAQFFVTPTSNGRIYLVENGVRSLVASTRQRALLALALGIPNRMTVVPDAVVDRMHETTAMQWPGTVVTAQDTGQKFLIDGADTVWRLSNVRAREYPVSGLTVASEADLAGYQERGWAHLGLTCGSTRFVANQGVLWRTGEKYVPRYLKVLKFFSMNPATCANMPVASLTLGAFIRTADGSGYYMKNGVKYPIANDAAYKRLQANNLPLGYRDVSGYFASRFPTGRTVR